MVFPGSSLAERVRTVLAVVAVLSLPVSCSSFGSSIPDDPLPDSARAGQAGLILTGSYRVATPAEWRYRRLNPTDRDGQVLLGSSGDGSVTYRVQMISVSNDQPTPTEIARETAAYAVREYRGRDLQAELVEYEERIDAAAWSESERGVSIFLPQNNEIVVITLYGSASNVFLSEENRGRIAGSFRPVESSGGPEVPAGIVRARLDGRLPEFASPTPLWEWIADVDGGFALAGTIDGVPAVVTITTGAETDDEPPAADGLSEPDYLFTGTALYRITSGDVTRSWGQLALTGDDGGYVVVVEVDRAERVEQVAALMRSADLMALLEHGVIFDSQELPQ